MSVLSVYEIQNIWAFCKDNLKYGISQTAAMNVPSPSYTQFSKMQYWTVSVQVVKVCDLLHVFMISISFGNNVYFKQLS